MCLALVPPAADPIPRPPRPGAGRGRCRGRRPDGKVEREFECKYDSHGIHLLPGGNLRLHTATGVRPNKEVVRKDEVKPRGGYEVRVEVHAFQRLADGSTVVAGAATGASWRSAGAARP